MELSEIKKYTHKIQTLTFYNDERNITSDIKEFVVKVNIPTSTNQQIRFSKEKNEGFIGHQQVNNDYYIRLDNNIDNEDRKIILYVHYFPKNLYQYESTTQIYSEFDLSTLTNDYMAINGENSEGTSYKTHFENDSLYVESMDKYIYGSGNGIIDRPERKDPNYKNFVYSDKNNGTTQGMFPLSSHYRNINDNGIKNYQSLILPDLSMALPYWQTGENVPYPSWTGRISREQLSPLISNGSDDGSSDDIFNNGSINLYLNYQYLPSSSDYHQHYFNFKGENDDNYLKIFERDNLNYLNSKFNDYTYSIINNNPFPDNYNIKINDIINRKNIKSIDLNEGATHYQCRFNKNKCQNYYQYSEHGVSNYVKKQLHQLEPNQLYSLKYFVYIPSDTEVNDLKDACIISVNGKNKVPSKFQLYNHKATSRDQWIYQEVPFIAEKENFLTVIGPQRYAGDNYINVFFDEETGNLIYQISPDMLFRIWMERDNLTYLTNLGARFNFSSIYYKDNENDKDDIIKEIHQDIVGEKEQDTIYMSRYYKHNLSNVEETKVWFEDESDNLKYNYDSDDDFRIHAYKTNMSGYINNIKNNKTCPICNSPLIYNKDLGVIKCTQYQEGHYIERISPESYTNPNLYSDIFKNILKLYNCPLCNSPLTFNGYTATCTKCKNYTRDFSSNILKDTYFKDGYLTYTPNMGIELYFDTSDDWLKIVYHGDSKNSVFFSNIFIEKMPEYSPVIKYTKNSVQLIEDFANQEDNNYIIRDFNTDDDYEEPPMVDDDDEKLWQENIYTLPEHPIGPIQLQCFNPDTEIEYSYEDNIEKIEKKLYFDISTDKYYIYLNNTFQDYYQYINSKNSDDNIIKEANNSKKYDGYYYNGEFYQKRYAPLITCSQMSTNNIKIYIWENVVKKQIVNANTPNNTIISYKSKEPIDEGQIEITLMDYINNISLPRNEIKSFDLINIDIDNNMSIANANLNFNNVPIGEYYLRIRYINDCYNQSPVIYQKIEIKEPDYYIKINKNIENNHILNVAIYDKNNLNNTIHFDGNDIGFCELLIEDAFNQSTLVQSNGTATFFIDNIEPGSYNIEIRFYSNHYQELVRQNFTLNI